jgi:hypothetical protein
MRPKKILVIATSLSEFFKQMESKFERRSVEGFYRTQGRFILKNGDEYIYITRPERLRGYHGAEVEFWGQHPDWYLKDIETNDALIRHARLA